MLKNRSLPFTTPESREAKDLVAKGQKYFTPNYKPRETIIDHGKGRASGISTATNMSISGRG